MKENFEQYLVTAGGRIKCHRCQAQSVRSKQQCRRPSLKKSKTHKCSSHGGLSTGPKTKKGKDAIRQAHWKHGNQTKEAKAKNSKKSLMFLMLEELAHHANMFPPNTQRTRGRKPIGFEKLDLNDASHLDKAIELSMPK